MGTESSCLLQFRSLKQRLEDGLLFAEYEQIPKKKADGDFTTATMPENTERSRTREVLPYEENRVTLAPTKENSSGYINASHIRVRAAWGALGSPTWAGKGVWKKKSFGCSQTSRSQDKGQLVLAGLELQETQA